MAKKDFYSDDYAMNYEYLIRRAHQCGRYGVEGADADTYRHFLRAASFYASEKRAVERGEPRKRLQPLDTLLSEYMVGAGEVKAHLNSAISHVLRNYERQLSDDQAEELEQVQVLLLEPTIEKITDAIDRAEKVMLDIGLYPG